MPAALGLLLLLIDVPTGGVVPPDEAAVQKLYADEPNYARDWPVEFHIRVVEPRLQKVARAFLDLDHGTFAEHFANDVRFGWGDAGEPKVLPLRANRRKWTSTASSTISKDEVEKRLRRYAAEFEYVDRTTLKVKTAKAPQDGRFEATAAFRVAGRETGGHRDDHGKIHVSFVRTPKGWFIDGFELVKLESDRSAALVFDDVTHRWLKDVPDKTRSRLIAKSASDYIFEKIQDGKTSRAQPVAMDAHPGVVVVDFDGDGFDDLFVWDVLGAAVLLRNNGKGRFEDASARLGVDLDRINGAAFADLDEDGFLDVVLAGWFRRTRILYGGKKGFADAKLELPAQVSTVAVADLNDDGRLDVFLGTAAHDHHARVAKEGADANVDQIGPPNVVLVNLGERRFADGTKRLGLELARNTLQASFADVDDDGLLDVFIGNDFAPGNLLFNERGVFVDASKKTGADQILFGMGATWGDVDGDGDLDLYASAMASSAGKRIMADDGFAASLTAQDRRRRHAAARGNTLLLNTGDRRFEDGTAREQYASTRGMGWSYGSTLIDVDNDGWLDVYAPNGFFTSPLAAPEDAYRDL